MKILVKYGNKFSYEDKKLLTKRAMGRKKSDIIQLLIKDENMPEDLKDVLRSYIVLQKLY